MKKGTKSKQNNPSFKLKVIFKFCDHLTQVKLENFCNPTSRIDFASSFKLQGFEIFRNLLKREVHKTNGYKFRAFLNHVLPKFNQNAVKIQSKCSQNAAKMQLKYCQKKSKCSQNAV